MIKKILSAQLQTGMYVSEIVCPNDRRPFWRSGRMMLNGFDVLKVKNLKPIYIMIDTRIGDDIKEDLDIPDAEVVVPIDPDTNTLTIELEFAESVVGEAVLVVSSIFSAAAMKESIDFIKVNNLLEAFSASLDRHSQALICLVRLKKSDDCNYLHSISVCCLMIALSRKLNHSLADSIQAGIAGLTHDIGKISIGNDILLKPGRLTEAEYESVKQHPLLGAKLLASAGVVNRSMIEVCLHHHEKVDGSGYPHGLVGDKISLLSRMAAICDVYDAITSDRPYKKAWCPGKSIREMASWKGHFDPKIFQAFVQVVGVYPNGTLVRLSSKRLAIVFDQNDNNLLLPVVIVVMCAATGEMLPKLVIDLSSNKNLEKIEGVENAENWGIDDLNSFWLNIVKSHNPQ